MERRDVMTDIETRARDALNEVRGGNFWLADATRKNTYTIEAMCRQIEAHDSTKAEFEAFKRDVSEAVRKELATVQQSLPGLSRFILPPPVDPWRGLKDALISAGVDGPTICEVICGVRERGLTIQGQNP